jgi:Leucine-rich repeat (LRR) protein
MVNCHTISLKKGFLSDLPGEFLRLGTLTSLNLDHNRFRKLPQVLLTLPGLKNLSFNFNNICDIPDEITVLTGTFLFSAFSAFFLVLSFFGAPVALSLVFPFHDLVCVFKIEDFPPSRNYSELSK